MKALKLLILGGTGGVGRQLVAQASAAGHELTLLVRPTTACEAPEGVRVLRGLLDDRPRLDEAMAGADAVLSCIGMQRANPANPWSASRSPEDLTSATARLIVAAMREHGVPRIVAVSAAGVGDSAAQLNLVMRFFLATSMIGTAYADLARMEAVYAESGLDWLAPRPTRLMDGAATGRVAVVERFGTRAAITRADVARWMLDALSVPSWPDPSWGGRTPQISAET